MLRNSLSLGNSIHTMAQSGLTVHKFTSEQFVESCGAIIFDLSAPFAPKVCLVHILKEDEWTLAKGRRNIGESRKVAALREVIEETGYQCHLLPVKMATRACADDAPVSLRDKPRVHDNITEPFMCTFRELPHGKGTKIGWWYVAILDDEAGKPSGPGEKTFKPVFFDCEEALKKLTFQSDRDVVERAAKVLEDTISHESET